ncbi:MAG: response regulator, partial [Planctomycetota bacterium]
KAVEARILVVDDEPGIREGCRKVLESEGYAVEVAEDGVQGCAMVTRKEEPFDLALIDLKMPNMDGVELLGRIRKHDPEIITIVITAYATLDTAIETTRKGAYGYVPKPFTPDELLLIVRRGLERRALSLRARRLQEERERNLLEVCGERNRCHAIINCMNDGLIVVNRDEQLALANPAALAIFRMPHMPDVGTPLGNCLENARMVEAIRGVLSSREKRYEVIARQIELQGDTVVMANIAPVYDDDGATLGAVVVLSDITELKQLEKEKAEFISMVSHELKSPLAAIENLIELILRGTFKGDKAREMLGRAGSRAEGARKMIDDLLNFSALEAGAIGRNKETMLVKDAVEDAVAAQQEFANEGKITIDTAQVNCEATMLADRDDMVKLFTNLISNAIKYNREGGRVTVACVGEHGRVEIGVSDTGIGMSPEHLEHIFDEFYRIRNESTKRISGTGLGLAIVKKIVAAYHGEISAESKPGEGTTFKVIFRGVKK